MSGSQESAREALDFVTHTASLPRKKEHNTNTTTQGYTAQAHCTLVLLPHVRTMSLPHSLTHPLTHFTRSALTLSYVDISSYVFLFFYFFVFPSIFVTLVLLSLVFVVSSVSLFACGWTKLWDWFHVPSDGCTSGALMAVPRSMSR